MRKSMLLAAPALALCLTTPAIAQDEPTVEEAVDDEVEEEEDEEIDPETFERVGEAFAEAAQKARDKDPIDPERLAVATTVAEAMWPLGAYGKAMREMFSGENMIFDMVMDMKPGEIIDDEDATPEEIEKTLREAAMEEDPYFEERLRIMMNVMGDMFEEMFAPIEPKMREGLARAYARSLTLEELNATAAFIATPEGEAFASKSLMAMMDKEVMLAMMEEMPTIFGNMPDLEKRLEEATAHLPPPPCKGDDEECALDDEPAETEDGDVNPTGTVTCEISLDNPDDKSNCKSDSPPDAEE